MSHTQVVQATSQEHNQIIEICLPIAEHILNNSAAFDACDDILCNNTSRGNALIGEFISR